MRQGKVRCGEQRQARNRVVRRVEDGMDGRQGMTRRGRRVLERLAGEARQGSEEQVREGRVEVRCGRLGRSGSQWRNGATKARTGEVLQDWWGMNGLDEGGLERRVEDGCGRHGTTRGAGTGQD